MRRPRVLATLLVVLAAMAGRASGAESATVDSILKAWSKRESKAPSIGATFHLEVDRFSRHESEGVSRQRESVDIHRWTIRLDGNSVQAQGGTYFEGPQGFDSGRFDFDRALNSAFQDFDREFHQPRGLTAFCDGIIRIDVWNEGNGRAARVVVLPDPTSAPLHVLSGNALNDASTYFDSLLYQPLMIAFRPFHPLYGGVNRARCKVLAERAICGGVACVCLQESPGDPRYGVSRRFWVDPERESVVRRYIGETTGRPTVQIDIDYERRASRGWVPTRWIVLRIDTPRMPVRRFVTAKLDELTMDRKIDSISSLPFIPPQAWVLNLRNSSKYVVRMDGTKEMIKSRAEQHADLTYQAYVNAQGANVLGDAMRGCGMSHRSWFMLGPSALVACLTGGMWKARRSKRRCAGNRVEAVDDVPE